MHFHRSVKAPISAVTTKFVECFICADSGWPFLSGIAKSHLGHCEIAR